jgi:hypothetical protein
VKESVPGENMEVKQDVTGEFFGLFILFCVLRILFCFCCNYVYFRDLWLLLLMKLLIFLLEVKAQADAMWEQMNKGVSSKVINGFKSKSKSPAKSTPKKRSSVILCRCFVFCFCIAIVFLTIN